MEFIDLKAQYIFLKDKIDKSINEVLSSAHFISGEQVGIFEKKLADYVGMKHAISCSDGTAALQLIYMAYGIGKGDAIFCPDLTFIASVEPACMLGAEAVFCDIDSKSYNLCPESLERQIKAVLHEGRLKPRAIVAVDFVGNPADYEKLSIIAKEYNMILIEDAAQSMGASINGKRCCTFGDIAATSFFPTKPLGCYGDGGAVFTNDDDIANIIRSLSTHGKGKSKYDNVRIGINSRLDTIQAAILISKLEDLTVEIEKRQIIAEKYDEAFKYMFKILEIEENVICAYAQYVLLAKDSVQREDVIQKLKMNNIPSLIYYPTPMHLLPVFKDTFCGNEKFENSIDYCNRTFSLPFSPYLLKEDQELIIDILSK